MTGAAPGGGAKAGAKPALIEARNLTRVLAETVPVTLTRDISFSVGDGEMVAVTGPSGSGKSSLLYLLGLLDEPTEGEVLVRGRPTHAMDEDARAAMRLATIGFVFQFHFLLPEFTARQNVAAPMRRLGALDREQAFARAGELLASFGLGEHADKLPEQLSGGQRQRVAVARALANDPPLILADEPTGSLDSAASEQVFEILREIVHGQGRTVIAVTHDIDMADRMDRRLHLVDGALVSDERRQDGGAPEG